MLVDQMVLTKNIFFFKKFLKDCEGGVYAF